MNLEVYAAESAAGTQARAYAEYRMFSAVSRFGTRCSRLNVYLEEAGGERDGAQYGCAAVLDLLPAGQVRVRASAGHLYAAIDRAAESLSRGVEKRLARKAESERSRS